MPNVTVPGYNNTTITIPVTSQQAVTVGDSTYAAILASVNANKLFTETTASTSQTINLPAGSTSINAITNNGTLPLTVNDASLGALTLISGLGGVTYTTQDTLTNAAGNVLVVSGGGPSTINLGFGTATVVSDGASTVNGINGGDTVFATAGGSTSVNAGAGAVVYAAGTDTVGFYGPNAKVFTQSGANLEMVGTGGVVNGTDSGSVTISALGSFTSYAYNGYGGNVYVDATANGHNSVGNAGTIFINAGNANVTVFAGAGVETLFGTGGAGGTALNSGSDLVNSGNGFFKGGSGLVGGGRNILETSSIAGAATLVGGSTVTGGSDQLYVQGAYDRATGNVNTSIIDASGQSNSASSISGFTFTALSGATPSGDLLNAGWARQVSIYGGAGGANTIVSGTGSDFATGNHGTAGTTGNTYVDGEGGSTGVAGGSITISDFIVGVDQFKLNGSTISTGPAAGGSSSVTLSDGTKVTLTNVVITTANQGSIFS